MSQHLPDLIEDFLRYLKVQRGRAVLTVRNYRLYLKRFLGWTAASRLNQINEMTKEKLRDYRLWLSHQRSQSGSQLSLSTQNYHLTALRSFFNYLKHKDLPILPASSINLSPPQKRKIITLTEQEKNELIRAVQNSPEPELVKLRDEALIELISATGLKVSEAVKLEKSQLDLSADKINFTRHYSKYNFFLSKNVCQLLKKYLEKRLDISPFIFIRHDRASHNNPGGITPRSVQRSLEYYRKLAGLKQKITPHTLRHLFASQLAAQGADLATLQKSLGLKNKSAVQVYQRNNKIATVDQK